MAVPKALDTQQKMQPFLRKEVANLAPVAWGAEAEGILLNWGYNPFPPSPMVAEAIRHSVVDSLQRYPAHSIKVSLTNRFAEYAKVRPESITIVNGCDKAFRLLAETFLSENDEVITLSPGYPVIGEAVRLMGARIIQVPLATEVATLGIVGAIGKRMSGRTKLVFLVNPNNPTSEIVVDPDELRQLLNFGCLLVVDEAYFEFGGWSSAPFLKDCDNLIILRSFSKTYSLPGARIGMIMSSLACTQAIRTVEENVELFNTSTLSLLAAHAALDDLGYYQDTWSKTSVCRERMTAELRELGVTVAQSKASFLFVTTPGIAARDLQEQLRRQKIFIKDMSIYDDVREDQSVIGLPPAGHYEFVMDCIRRIISRSQ